MHHQSTRVPALRYYKELEPEPHPKRRFWRRMWLVRDRCTSNHTILDRFFAHGAAELLVDCLNGTAPAVLCQRSAPADSHGERLAVAA